jgi:septin family protein
MFLYSIRLILNRLSDYVGTIAAKRYRLYLKEEERKRRHTEWMQYVIAAILWLVKLITNSLEKVNIKSMRVSEKVTVE